MLTDSFEYRNGQLFCDEVTVHDIAAQTGTPVYVYSLGRALNNLRRIRSAFAELHPEIHYSAKANANLAVLRTLVEAGAGIDAVSAGEIHKALLAGAKAQDIVFAGVGKTRDEIRYALAQGVGWFNVENVLELQHINDLVTDMQRPPARVALRLNPDIAAPTHRYIATGHKGAKFGLSIQVVKAILADRAAYPNLRIEGIHIHIGSQLHNTDATRKAVETALGCIAPYPDIRTVNMGGGLAVRYAPDEDIPRWEDFGAAVTPLLRGYEVMLEPGRSIIADAGMLVISVLYVKEQGGENLLITDGSMAELIRPALYEAHHEIVPVAHSSHRTEREAEELSMKTNSPQRGENVKQQDKAFEPQRTQRPEGERGLFSREGMRYHIVGPVCESADALGHSVPLSEPQPGDLLAVLTAGAYGSVMSSNYNQRPRPPEVVVETNGKSWRIARQRETWDDLIAKETI